MIDLRREPDGFIGNLGPSASMPALRARSREDAEGIRDLLEYLGRYAIGANRAINADETIAYGSWVLKFVRIDESCLELYEYDHETSDFVIGVNTAVQLWKSQHDVCARFGAEFLPPRFDQKAAVSRSILTGISTLEGVRYSSPEHMSGWWITADDFDGNVDSLSVVHVHHVISGRPDLASMLALPPGYRFMVNRDSSDVWFDPEAAAVRD